MSKKQKKTTQKEQPNQNHKEDFLNVLNKAMTTKPQRETK